VIDCRCPALLEFECGLNNDFHSWWAGIKGGRVTIFPMASRARFLGYGPELNERMRSAWRTFKIVVWFHEAIE